jgi:hypothetical protein
MNPYVSDSDNIAVSDRYADIPLYGRYCPKPDDFTVDPQHANSHSPDALRYWASVIAQCTESNQIYPADGGGRDVFALGTVIIKSSHLHEEAEIDYSYADANEVQAIDLARSALKDGIRVPEVYFSGKVYTHHPIFPLLFIHKEPCAYWIAGEWSQSACPRAAPWRRPQRGVVVFITGTKRVFQSAGARNSSLTSHREASPKPAESRPCGSGPKHPHQRSNKSGRG